jgi:hypothetical protein
MMTLYRYEPTGEVRVPKEGDYFYSDVVNSVLWAVGDGVIAYPIYRRVPHDPDTAAKVAFAEMWLAYDVGAMWNEGRAREYDPLMCRFVDGDRSPELTAKMIELTQKMRGTS